MEFETPLQRLIIELEKALKNVNVNVGVKIETEPDPVYDFPLTDEEFLRGLNITPWEG